MRKLGENRQLGNMAASAAASYMLHKSKLSQTRGAYFCLEKAHEKTLQDKLRTVQGVAEISAQIDMKITMANQFFAWTLDIFLTLLIPIRYW